MILIAKTMGIKLSVLQGMVDDFESGRLTEVQILDFLKRQLSDVRERITALQQAETLLLSKLAHHQAKSNDIV